MSDDEKPKIKGYRQLEQPEIDGINFIKAKAAEVGEMIDRMQKTEGFDQRAIAIAKTELQTGFMWLTRSIAQPDSF